MIISEEKCLFCGLPLYDNYIVYKGKKVHQTCFRIEHGELMPSYLAEDIKAISKIMNEKDTLSLDEAMEILQVKNNYAIQSTCRNRARHILKRMMLMDVSEEIQEKRQVIRFVTVWRKRKK